MGRRIFEKKPKLTKQERRALQESQREAKSRGSTTTYGMPTAVSLAQPQVRRNGFI